MCASLLSAQRLEHVIKVGLRQTVRSTVASLNLLALRFYAKKATKKAAVVAKSSEADVDKTFVHSSGLAGRHMAVLSRAVISYVASLVFLVRRGYSRQDATAFQEVVVTVL